MRSACICAAIALAPVPAVAGKIYGLVIGVDEYQFITDLHGAVNDARDIEDALSGIGAEVTTLLNDAASRDAVMAEWRRLAELMTPADQLIVTYAGHGSNEPEAIKGSEQDGRDENLLLAGFSPYGTSAGERIRDDEIAELLALSQPGQVIFVADACHSGTLSRDLTPSLGYRYVAVNGIKNDPLPPPPPRQSEGQTREQAALFLAAAHDSEKTPEFLINGQARGALSYSFAASLRDKAADANGDDQLTKGEIETYVRRKVRAVSQGAQRPQVSPAGQSDALLFAFNRQIDRVDAAISDVTGTPFDALPALTFYSDGPVNAAFEGITQVDDKSSARMRLSTQSGVLHSMVGDEILRVGLDDADKVQGAIDTHRLVDALEGFAGGLDVRFSDGDRTYSADDIVKIETHGRSSRHVALLNVASNGEISFLYPSPAHGDPLDSAAHDQLHLPVQVKSPFGADHVIAIETQEASPDLLRMLRQFDGSNDIAGLWNAFRGFASVQRKKPIVAVFPFYTSASREG